MTRLRTALALLLLAAAPRAAAAQSASPYDVLVTNARVVDGTGNPWYRADVGIRQGRIVEVGLLAGRPAARVIDARDRVLAPGFIDMMGTNSTNLLTDPPSAESKLRQGLTTLMVGEGGSVAPQNARTIGEGLLIAGRRRTWRTFGEYFALVEERGVPLNLVHNVGAAQVRRVVLGDSAVAPTPAQLREMERLVAEAMRDGAAGISTALIYPPGTYATTDEIVALSRTAARAGGIYLTHMRNESAGVLDAIREALAVGQRAGIPVHIYHLKAAGEENWPLVPQAIALIQGARDRGQDVTADVYPYVRNGINLGSFLHPRHYAAGEARFLPTLAQPAVRAALRREVETTADWENWYRHVGRSWENVLITSAAPAISREVVGRSVAAVAAARGADVWDTFFDLVQNGDVGVAPRSMDEGQKEQALRAPFVAIDTDSPPTNPRTEPSAHPRAFGSFPRVLATYVRERRVLPLEEAVRKMTSLPANILRLRDRGRIAPGMAADLVVFDPATVQDRATFTEPLRHSTGIDYLIVNGAVVIDGGALTAARPGRVLRHGAR